MLWLPSALETLAVKMDKGNSSSVMEKKDFRVNVKSKRIIAYQLVKYKPLLRKLLDGQMQLSEDEKNTLFQELLTNFEAAVQENILVDGLSWHEAPEVNGDDSECNTLDDMLDETIVQTTWKRSTYPRKILPYAVKTLKAERKLMNLFETTVKLQELKQETVQDIMNNVSTAAPMMFSQASTVMKSLKCLKHTAEGLHQVLNMQPSTETLDVYRDVFSRPNKTSCEALCDTEPAKGNFNQRVVSDEEFSKDYIALLQLPTTFSK